MPTWDTAKARANAAKHGVEFRDAAAVFDAPHVLIPDRRHDYREPRYLAIGEVEGVCLTVVFTWRGADRRVISARKSSPDESQALQPHLSKIGARYATREGGPHS